MEYLRHTDHLKKLGAKVKKTRESLGISQDELSFRTSLAKSQIGRIERGEINTGISTLYEIAMGLGVDIKDLL